MAGVQPTQVLPPWLAVSTFTTVDATGGPTTETTLVMLPLTYLGPSIPLGSNGVWTFGGSTFPASIELPNTSSSPSPSPSISATLTSNTATTSTQPTSSMLFSTTPTASSSFRSSSISSTSAVQSSGTPSSSTMPMPSRHRKLGGNSIAAIVIVCSFFIIMVSFILFLCCRRGGRLYNSRYRIWSDLESRLSRRYMRRRRSEVRSGDDDLEAREIPQEQDPLVPVSLATEVEVGAEVPPRLVPSRLSREAPVGIALSDGRLTPSSTFTSLLREELLGAIRSTPSLFFHENDNESQGLPTTSSPPRRGTPRSPIGAPGEPLLPPPSINPDQVRPVSQFASDSNRSMIPSIAYPDSPISDIDETAALMTAARVRVQPRESSTIESGGMGMRLARLGRLSWFDRTPPDEEDPVVRRSESMGSGTLRRQQEMSQRNSLAVSHRNRFSISATTASSGPTVYYDANSRPRSQVSASGIGSDQWGYNLPDILDMPAPPSAAATFSSSGSRPVHLRHPPGLNVTDSQASLEDEPPTAEQKWDSVRTASSARSSVRQGKRTMALMTSDTDVSGERSGGRRRSDTFNSGTTETIVTDQETGAVMHFPTKVWTAEEGEGEWPDDAWTEFPAPGQARWWGPPKSLVRYREQTGDLGLL